jgi:hypothetical protein
VSEEPVIFGRDGALEVVAADDFVGRSWITTGTGDSGADFFVLR